MLPELLAQRFARIPTGWIDVATGTPVAVLGYDDLPLRREARERMCEAAASHWHSALVPVVDYGELGDGRWIEAWAMPADAVPWRGHGAGAARRAVHEWLALQSAGRPGLDVLEVDGRPMALPGLAPVAPLRARAARRAATSSKRQSRVEGRPAAMGRTMRPAFAVRLLPRPLSQVLLDRLEELRETGPHVWAIDMPPGSGARQFWLQLARAARRHGFVPVHARWIDCCLRPPAGGEERGLPPLLVWHELAGWTGQGRRALASLLIRLGASGPAPHVVLDVVRRGRPHPAALLLGPLEPDALTDVVWWHGARAPTRRLLQAFAHRAAGWPKPFVSQLRAHAEGAGDSSGRPPLRVHEALVPYGADDRRSSRNGSQATERVIARAAQLSKAGRPAAGLRHLRRSLTACARRGEGESAATLALAQARLAEIRGAPEAVAAAWHSAHRVLDMAGPAPARVALAVAVGRAWCRDGRLVKAESLLRAALESAVALGDVPQLTTARAALARCLCWQARWADARTVLCDTATVEAHAIRVWLLLAQGDVPGASAAASAALALARTVGQPEATADALAARARCDAVCGDRERVREATAEILALSSEAGVLGTGARAVFQLEAAVYCGLERVSRAVTQAAGRLARPGWPRLLRCRARLALALRQSDAAGRAHLETLIRRFVLETGAAALLPDARASWPWPPTRRRSMPILSDVMEVLQACQAADGPEAALHDASRVVRDRTGAAAVAVVGTTAGAGVRTLALAGRTPGLTAARRAIALKLPVRPDAAGDAIEAASPVLHGTDVLGAVCCRWSAPDRAPDEDTMALLETVATAVAPTVRLTLELAAAGQPPPAGDDDGLIGGSAAIGVVRRQVRAAGCAPFPVLIEGESGSGKELVARAIHRHSPRRDRAFCALNCAALGDDLIEAELFGHARGAFTGAATERPGLFEEADGGTLFLDEVSELSARAQAKLLRVLQEGEIRRLGETRPRRVDVRVIAATNRPVRDLVAAGRFRHDLRYRLDVVRIEVPPLRARADDVPVLVRHYWQKAAGRVNSRAVLAPETCAALVSYEWPGNVRELQNVLASLAVSAPRTGRIGPSSLPSPVGLGVVRPVLRLEEARRQFEAAYVRTALAHAGGSRVRAAAALGLTRQGLAKLMERLQVSPDVAGVERRMLGA